ncbi:hypothetical protein KO566_11450 [Flavobacteriaceae bacterium XHP0103]|uniref:hypothetical protein n=1 Tax=Marixanthotalea marina TaxID=2844359 RepID=UPI002989EAAD|nr:hypothetical protein [Marixanthotalea marina]MBU3822679.1 hypothetical protein [Marixanthotalea marina]
MKKIFLSISILSLLFASCTKEQNPFLIGKNHVGLLTDSTQVRDIAKIFSNDSIVTNNSANAFMGPNDDIEIYEKGGNKLLILTPAIPNDSTSYIRSVRIMDPRYKTKENITVSSTFKDVSDNYKINKVDNMLGSVIVYAKEINAMLTIDKKELPANMRFDTSLKIEAIHIPDNAKIKYFFLNWNKS